MQAAEELPVGVAVVSIKFNMFVLMEVWIPAYNFRAIPVKPQNKCPIFVLGLYKFIFKLGLVVIKPSRDGVLLLGKLPVVKG